MQTHEGNSNDLIWKFSKWNLCITYLLLQDRQNFLNIPNFAFSFSMTHFLFSTKKEYSDLRNGDPGNFYNQTYEAIFAISHIFSIFLCRTIHTYIRISNSMLGILQILIIFSLSKAPNNAFQINIHICKYKVNIGYNQIIS